MFVLTFSFIVIKLTSISKNSGVENQEKIGADFENKEWNSNRCKKRSIKCAKTCKKDIDDIIQLNSDAKCRLIGNENACFEYSSGIQIEKSSKLNKNANFANAGYKSSRTRPSKYDESHIFSNTRSNPVESDKKDNENVKLLCQHTPNTNASKPHLDVKKNSPIYVIGKEEKSVTPISYIKRTEIKLDNKIVNKIKNENYTEDMEALIGNSVYCDDLNKLETKINKKIKSKKKLGHSINISDNPKGIIDKKYNKEHKSLSRSMDSEETLVKKKRSFFSRMIKPFGNLFKKSKKVKKSTEKCNILGTESKFMNKNLPLNCYKSLLSEQKNELGGMEDEKKESLSMNHERNDEKIGPEMIILNNTNHTRKENRLFLLVGKLEGEKYYFSNEDDLKKRSIGNLPLNLQEYNIFEGKRMNIPGNLMIYEDKEKEFDKKNDKTGEKVGVIEILFQIKESGLDQKMNEESKISALKKISDESARTIIFLNIEDEPEILEFKPIIKTLKINNSFKEITESEIIKEEKSGVISSPEIIDVDKQNVESIMFEIECFSDSSDSYKSAQDEFSASSKRNSRFIEEIEGCSHDSTIKKENHILSSRLEFLDKSRFCDRDEPKNE